MCLLPAEGANTVHGRARIYSLITRTGLNMLCRWQTLNVVE